MSVTQIRGNTQIIDLSVSTTKLADHLITPVKISNTGTDDFSFPRDITVGRTLATDTVKGKTTDLTLTHNSGFPLVSLQSSGLILAENDGSQGTDDNRYFAISMDNGRVANASHRLLDIANDSLSGEALDIGYTMNGAGTGMAYSWIHGGEDNVTPIPLHLGSHTNDAVILQTSGDADFQQNVRLIGGNSLILGNSDNAYLTYDATVGGVVVNSESDNNTTLASRADFTLYSNVGSGSGSFYPSVEMYQDGHTVLRNDSQGADATRRFLGVSYNQDITAGDKATLIMNHDGTGGIGSGAAADYMYLGYRADGSVVTSALIQTLNSLPLTLGTTSSPDAIIIEDNSDVDFGGNIRLDDNNKVILGSSDNAWIESSTSANTLVMNSQATGATQVGAIEGFEIYSNLGAAPTFTGQFDPWISIGSGGQGIIGLNAVSQGSDGGRRVTVSVENGAGFGEILRLKRGTGTGAPFLSMAYEASGSDPDGFAIMTQAGSSYIKFRTSGNPQQFSLNADGSSSFENHLVHDVVDPVSAQDAATKNYVDNITIDLTTDVTGTLPVANGGTNSNTPLAGNFLIVSNGTSLIEANGSDFSMDNGKITNVKTPTASQDAANKAYVDMAVNGLDWKQHAAAATAAPLPASTYNNGASGVGATITSTDGAFPVLVIDGYTVLLNDRVLIKNQASAFQNGIYVLTTTDNGNTTEWVLTRATDSNTPALLEEGTAVFSTNGSTYADKGFIQTAAVTTVGTSAVTYIQFTSAVSAYFAGNGLDLAVDTFSISTDDSLTAFAGGSVPSLIVKEDPAGAITTNVGAGIKVNVAAAGGIQITSNALSIKKDVTTANTIGVTSTSNGAGVLFDANSFVDSGSETLALASGVAGNGLSLTTGVLSVNVASTGGLQIVTDNVSIKSDTTTANTIGVTTTANGAGVLFDANSFVDAGSETLALASGVAGDGLALTSGVLSVNVDNATIEINSDTLRVKDLGITTAKIAAGAVTYAKTSLVTREVPSGTINGSNVTFTLANTPATAGSEHLYLNGILQNAGAGNDYTISSATITFANAPQSGDVVLVSYWK